MDIRNLKKFIVFVMIFWVVAGIIVHVYWLDGLEGAFYELLFGDTEYSIGYREYKFRRIQVGMTEDNVISILGEPLFKSPHFPNVWFYSYGKKPQDVAVNLDLSTGDYTERIVEFRNGKVIDIHNDFYFD